MLTVDSCQATNHPIAARLALIAGSLALITTACQGNLSTDLNEDQDAPKKGSSSDAPAAQESDDILLPGEDKAPASCSERREPAPSTARVLTTFEYNNAVRELFRGVDMPEQEFAHGERVMSFTIQSRENVSTAQVDAFRDSAEALAKVATPHASHLLACDQGARQLLYQGTSSGQTNGWERYELNEPIEIGHLELRLMGNDTHAWNAVREVRVFQGDEQLSLERPLASASNGREVTQTLDGELETWWAGKGRDVILTYALSERARPDRVEIAWAFGDQRRALFEVFGVASAPRSAPDACATRFIERLGAKAFRRALTPEERDALLALYEQVEEKGEGQGVGIVVEAILQAPSFLYLHEAVPAQGEGSRALSDQEIAQRMASLLWRALPDEALNEAAARGDLRDAQKREAQARRMLTDGRARVALRELVFQWLGLGDRRSESLEVDSLTAKQALALSDAMVEESSAFVEHVLAHGSGSYKELLTAPYTFIEAPLADHYGVDLARAEKISDKTYRVSLEDRTGLLHHASFLSVNHHSDLIRRGQVLRTALLCQEIDLPPEAVDTASIVTREGESQRSIAGKRLADPVCGGCHRLMDPLGLTFDVFDASGMYRDVDEHGNALSPHGELVDAAELDGELADSHELVLRLADSEQVRSCVAKHLFAYSFARPDSPDDQCALETIDAALTRHDGDLREALVAITQLDAFLTQSRSSGE